jgi:hypothetical protein
MSALATFVLVALATPALAQRPPAGRSESCEVCHGAEARLLRASVHAGAIDCVTCHGGVPGQVEVAKAHGPDLRPLGDARSAVESCGGCHSDVETIRSYGLQTDQLSLYRTSRHGAKLAEDADAPVASCVTCHGSHTVLRATDPLSPVHPRRQPETCGACHADAARMSAAGLEPEVVDAFRGSVHGRELLERENRAAPTCSDCHGSHGAVPPRTGEVRQVCGQCHSVVQRFYDESPHARLAGDDEVRCTACHDHHATPPATPDLFVGAEPGRCGQCHSGDGDPAVEVARRLRADVDGLAAAIGEVDDAIAREARRGLFLGEERGYLEEARGLHVRAKTMTHTLSTAALDDVLNRGRSMVQMTRESLATKDRVFRDRRIYTAIFFAVSIAFAIALSMYAHALAGRWKRATGGRHDA